MRALLLAFPLLLANAEDPPIPPTIKAMLDAAMSSGNEADVAVIVKYAKTADPASAPLVAKIAGEWRSSRREVAQQALREAHFLQLVKGHVELGGYVQTGNSENIGVTAAAEVKREGIEWRHKVRVQADYQESLGLTTRERYLAAYEPNWKFDDRAYMYGAGQYESDRFSGFGDRVSLSAGAGYSAIKSSAVKLDVELGPAYRYTRFIGAPTENNIAARGSLDFSWRLSRGMSITQQASAYVEKDNSTVATKSALLAKLIGPLSAQFSYTVQYESSPPLGRLTTDTTSRAALVVDF
ncbi:DUF481 domain-containing protein [Sphingomonas sp. ABOLD]|uniref:Putative salt-induced outer membrane protein n=1 Tax=Sphingomonas trueperi TaxID=53317 RepID=A0A7X5XZW0_9SPHN|nr:MULTISPECIES: DUF481 domain-containing protein [Sphingomonas]NJB97175.1 putative salt-induced outer membrane protein [Sphingomonas trueperi]RSV49376.1 DUF481 domain-containing protein [Sphingomonas sp. ABOLD]